MTEPESRQVFYRAPSGRIHNMLTCSSAAPRVRMVTTYLTHAEFDGLRASISAPGEGDHRCRCARWRETS